MGLLKAKPIRQSIIVRHTGSGVKTRNKLAVPTVTATAEAHEPKVLRVRVFVSQSRQQERDVEKPGGPAGVP